MNPLRDGPASPNFHPVRLRGGTRPEALATAGVSPQMADAGPRVRTGTCVGWGIPFRVNRLHVLRDRPVTLRVEPCRAEWLIFKHASDMPTPEQMATRRGPGRLAQHAADYVIVYADGSESRFRIRRGYEIRDFRRAWGGVGATCVADHKPYPVRPLNEQTSPWPGAWGGNLKRAEGADSGRPWIDHLCAWKNPHPRKTIKALRLEPVSGIIVLSAVTCGRASAMPLRWRSRRKALLRLPRGVVFDPELDGCGCLKQIQVDMGQVISALLQPVYPDADWGETDHNRVPALREDRVLIEYTAHPDARFHFANGRTLAVARLRSATSAAHITTVRPADQTVTLRVIDATSRRPVPVKLHVHGEAGEYLPPIDRHRIPNPAWFEDYSVDFLNQGRHWCTYIDGETTLKLPLGRVFIEVSKGFEIRPIRTVRRVSRATREIELTVKRVLPWRERGWVTADTHVHFLSPATAQLEGAAEGVNVVNLLASQWGELMTNVGDFDGRTTFGSKEAGGDGEYLVRVGTENRQHVLGHISLLGYQGRLIGPMTTGGPDESALGDPVEVLLTEWARQCHRQRGLVVIPHFPNPRLENAATLVSGDADAIEMTSWGNLYQGIDPYSLADWYRYLNCGYFVPAVGGTDKMSATTPVGAIRTYARIPADRSFTYENWMRAVRGGDTFCTYGPLLEFAVEGRAPGARLKLPATGGTVEVTWEAASVTLPMSRVELVVNGEVRGECAVAAEQGRGHWRVKLERSSWLALRVRGHYADKPEMLAAHSSPVAVKVGNTPWFAAADALTILEQIEGALAYLDTLGTRAQATAYKRMRQVLTGIHRAFHNRMHRLGHDHRHTAVHRHPGHGQAPAVGSGLIAP